MKYLPWTLVALIAIALIWALMVVPGGEIVGVVNLTRIVDESPRAQQLNQQLSQRFEELVIRFDLAEEPEEEDLDRANREREAYSEYLAYRLELETQFQIEVDEIIQKVAEAEKVSVVLDEDVVRFGGKDLSDIVIKMLE